MRSDIKKQLCEHERYNSSDRYGNHRRVGLIDRDERKLAAGDDEPFGGYTSGGRESMRHRYNFHWGRKEFGENLSPLEGIVRKNQGRRWDDVYSEICKAVGSRDSATGEHIFQHLFDYIETVTYIEDGEVYYVESNRWGGGRHRHISESFADFYVHPISGCITRNGERKKSYKTIWRERAEEEKKAQLQVRRILSDRHELRKVGNDWFSFEFLPAPMALMPVKNGEATRLDQTEHDNRPGMLARKVVAKKQLSRKELKQYNLLP